MHACTHTRTRTRTHAHTHTHTHTHTQKAYYCTYTCTQAKHSESRGEKMGLEGRFKFQSQEEKRWVLRADLNFKVLRRKDGS